MPCKQVSLSIGAQLENLEGGSFARTLEKRKVYLGSYPGPGGH